MTKNQEDVILSSRIFYIESEGKVFVTLPAMRWECFCLFININRITSSKGCKQQNEKIFLQVKIFVKIVRLFFPASSFFQELNLQYIQHLFFCFFKLILHKYNAFLNFGVISFGACSINFATNLLHYESKFFAFTFIGLR